MSTASVADIDTRNPADRLVLARWLLVCAILVFAMVVLGGVTRLTRSGLSIAEWAPVRGALPPLTQTQWDRAFALYQGTPEYLHVNAGMSLGEFKRIFYIEWSHRLLGRVIGVVFLVPLLYFLARRRVDRALARKLFALFALGGLQGALGWYMVASGLVDVPRVSAYRLTAHLGLAVLIYGYMVWIALGLLTPRASRTLRAPLTRPAWSVVAAVFVMILTGGLVAGTRAGFVYNTFPLMNGGVVPPGAFALEPWWLNPFENVATVQFDHRLMAYVLVGLVAALALRVYRVRAGADVRTALQLLLAALAAQIALGIATLVYVVPLPLAAAHQAGALLVYTAALYLTHRVRVSPSS